MGDKRLPIQVSTIALNNEIEERGISTKQEQEIGVDKLQITQFVHATTGQEHYLCKDTKDIPISLSRTWHQHGESCILAILP